MQSIRPLPLRDQQLLCCTLSFAGTRCRIPHRKSFWCVPVNIADCSPQWQRQFGVSNGWMIVGEGDCVFWMLRTSAFGGPLYGKGGRKMHKQILELR